MAECIDRIDLFNKKYGQVQRAFIYDRSKETILPDGTVQEGKPVIKYEAGMLHYLEDIKFTDADKKIVRHIMHRVDSSGIKTFTLHAPKDATVPLTNIDWKTEVQNALNK